MNAPTKLVEVTPQTITFTLDGKTIHAFDGETIFKAAKRHGIDIPHLCYKDDMRADGNCRACVVEVKGERVLAPSCCRNATAGMEVHQRTKGPERAPQVRRSAMAADLGRNQSRQREVQQENPAR